MIKDKYPDKTLQESGMHIDSSSRRTQTAEWELREKEIDRQWYDADEDGVQTNGNDLFQSYQNDEFDAIQKEKDELLIRKKQMAQPISKR